MFNSSMFSFQTITEKHKLNVPETMTEVLDVSDEEGETCSVLYDVCPGPTGGLSCVHTLRWPVGVGESVVTAGSHLHLCLSTGTLATWGRRVVTGVFAVAGVFHVLPLAGLGRGRKLEGKIATCSHSCINVSELCYGALLLQCLRVKDLGGDP